MRVCYLHIRLVAVATVGILSLTAGSLAAETSKIRCHHADQQRSDTDLEIVVNTEKRQVSQFSFWDEVETLFWGEDVIYWMAKGRYSEASPQFALAGFHIETSQLIVKVINASAFDDSTVAKMLRSDSPPLNCYRIGL